MSKDLPQQRRLAAIMFTDMVSYSALSQKNEALALELLNEHRRILRELFTLYGGREIEAIGTASSSSAQCLGCGPVRCADPTSPARSQRVPNG
jgi:class 3 adenylate cyclase